MDKINILGTGLSGMVGTRVKQLLSPKFLFEDLSLETGFDITDYDSVLKTFAQSQAKTVLHMAAKTDVDSCEDDKILGEEGQAWVVNVEGTRNIVDAAQKTGKRTIYISTDFVFDGTKDFYTEEDEPNPINWYAVTKYEGEVLIRSESGNTIIRIAYPFINSDFPKKDFARRLIERFKNGQKVFGLTDHIFTPTYIDDIAEALNLLLTKPFDGIFHVVGSQSLTPYEASQSIAKLLKFDTSLIVPTTRQEYFKGRAYRPFKLSLKNDKITGLGVKMRSFEEGLKEFIL
ncbi:NAD(P)-dependent oxidoreductase [Candidatus Gottesmanbacteria bacterium]|nr:NAD(P)-dependent oxidoreductase [Candidatus Gottesmanbacteria bacterium]